MASNWLRRAGQLQVKRTGAKLAPDRTMPVAGWLQVVAFSLFCIAGVFQIGFSGEPAWKQMLGQVSVASIWFGWAWMLNKLYIEPWGLLRKVGLR